MKKEIWKPIKGWEGSYEISNLGRIKIIKWRRHRFKKPSYYKNYARTRLYKNDKHQSTTIHRLVALNFLKKPVGIKTEVGHLDGNPRNNHIENLKWVTRSENAGHRVLHGTDSRGEKYGASILTNKIVLKLRKEHDPNVYGSCSTLAKKYGLNQDTVRSILNRTRWKHI